MEAEDEEKCQRQMEMKTEKNKKGKKRLRKWTKRRGNRFRRRKV